VVHRVASLKGILVLPPYTLELLAYTRCCARRARQPSSTFRKPDRLAVDVGVRVVERVAHAGLRGQVHHAVEASRGKQRRHAGAVGDVQLLESGSPVPAAGAPGGSSIATGS
jgi:hypothetical protein